MAAARPQRQIKQTLHSQEIAVFVGAQPAVCAECGKDLPKGGLFYLEEQKTLCLDCAVLNNLELLPSGDVALTRRASKLSRRSAVVLEWSRRGKRYERRGTLVEPEAIRLARAECEADASARAAQRARAAERRELEEREYIAAFTLAVQTQFPGCPLSEARAIAEHACAKYSGRVGRTASAKDLEREAVRLAVIAHVRHMHTAYDQIIERTRHKSEARSRIRQDVQGVLRAWEHSPDKGRKTNDE